MRFIWVNDGATSSHSICAACGRSIESSYLRHIETRFCYCDHGCYASVHPDNPGIGPFTADRAGAVPVSALTFLHRNGTAIQHTEL
jgi:hypothetical protein